jgi:hypothetical protein
VVPLKNQAFVEQFHQNNVDPNLTKKWFSSWKRWTAIKRFLKISDPNKDKENKHTDIVWEVQWMQRENKGERR